jgi:hypothetical protein
MINDLLEKNKVIVLENLVEKTLQDEIETEILSAPFPWYFMPATVPIIYDISTDYNKQNLKRLLRKDIDIDELIINHFFMSNYNLNYKIFHTMIGMQYLCDIHNVKLIFFSWFNNLEELSEALIYFHEKTGTRVTFEYIIFKDFNDEIEDAQELAQFCKCVPCKINIIEYNPIDDGQFQQADPQKVIAFANYLEAKNLIVNVRRSRGKDIDAACGQLANKNKAIPLQERILKGLNSEI